MTNQNQIQIPAGRDTLNSHNQAKTFSWSLKAPKNKVLQSIKVRARVNLTGTAAGSVFMHKLFSAMKLNGKGLMLSALEDSIPMTAVISHAKKEDNMYEVAPSTTDIVRNPAITAAATDYDCVYDFHCPAPGNNFVFSVELKKIVDVITWATAASFDIIVTANWTTSRGQKQYSIDGAVNNALSEKSYPGVIGAAILADVNWTTLLGSIDIDGSLTSDQVAELEDLTNDNLRGLAADSSGTTRTLPVADPADGAAVYAILRDMETPGDVKLKLNAATTFVSVMFREDGGI